LHDDVRPGGTDHTDLAFDLDGVTILRGAFDATGMADALWTALSRRHRILPDDPSTWKPGGFGKLTKFGKSGPFAGVATDAVRDAITEAFGCEWYERERWGQPLITFPTPGTWTVPHDSWHIDFPATSPMPALRMFAYLSNVAVGGGGTLVITGSHRLVAAEDGTRSAKVRARLAERSPWFRDLWRPIAGDDRVARFMDDGATVDGVDVRVVELTGQPGDVVLWHPALFHGIAPNCTGEPRFMLTHTAYPGPRPPREVK
jgi:hypothetical protein